MGIKGNRSGHEILAICLSFSQTHMLKKMNCQCNVFGRGSIRSNQLGHRHGAFINRFNSFMKVAAELPPSFLHVRA